MKKKDKIEIEDTQLGQRDVSRSAIIKTELEDEDYSPYCKNCNSCGHDGCCSALSCLYSSLKTNADKNCSYGEGYYDDIAFYYNLGQELYDLIDKSGDSEMKGKMEELYNKLYEEIYK